MNFDVNFDEFLHREWTDAVHFAIRQKTRLPHFEQYLAEREVDIISRKSARSLFDYIRLVVKAPLPSIEKHVLADPNVANEYERFKKDNDPNNDGGGLLQSFVRRIWNQPTMKSSEHVTNWAKGPEVNAVVSAIQSEETTARTFLDHVHAILKTRVEKSFDATFRNVETSRRHVGRFYLVEDDMLLVSGSSWFVVDPGREGKFASLGQWPNGTDAEQVRRGWQVKLAIDALAKGRVGNQLPVSFREAAHPTAQAKMALSGDELIVTFGRDDKRLAYETKAPFRRRELPSPAELEISRSNVLENRRRMTELLQISEARRTNILKMLAKEPSGVTDKDGYYYKLTEDGKSVQRTNWNGKTVETFSREEFDEMEQTRLSKGNEASKTHELGMSR